MASTEESEGNIEKNNRTKYFLLTCLSSVELRPVTRQMQTIVSQKPCAFNGKRGEKKNHFHAWGEMGGRFRGGRGQVKKTVEIPATARR